MGYSAWKIWFHPRLTRRVLSGFESEAEAARAEAEALKQSEAALRSELAEQKRLLQVAEGEKQKLAEAVETLSAQIVKSRREYDRLNEELAALRREHADTLRELDEREEAAVQISRFEKMMERAEQMKQNYEQRIQRLRAEIIRLREYSGEGNPTADEIRQIDMRNHRNDDEWLISNF